ncbi:MAG: hypothetical protein ACMG57_01185, partial [Candidatus Dojkabacteria bacterium]
NVEMGDTNGAVKLTLNSICNATTNTTHAWSTTVASAEVCNVFDDNADTDTITGVNFSRSDLYFELTFDPSGMWTTLSSPPAGIEIFPRTKLRAAPSAFIVQSLSGFSADQFLQLSPSLANNKIQIDFVKSNEGGFRVSEEGKIQFKDKDAEWINIADSAEVSDGFLWEQKGKDIFLTSDLETSNGLSYIKVSGKGKLTFNSEAIEFRDSSTNDWKGLSGLSIKK